MSSSSSAARAPARTRVLHLLAEGRAAVPGDLLQLQAAEFDVEVVDLSRPGLSYEALIDRIFASDRVVCW